MTWIKILENTGRIMPNYKIDVFVDENYVRTLYVEADGEYEAEEQVRQQLTIEMDIEELD